MRFRLLLFLLGFTIGALAVLLLPSQAQAKYRHSYRGYYYGDGYNYPNRYRRDYTDGYRRHARRDQREDQGARDQVKRGDKLPSVDPGLEIDLPYWEPFPIMGRPAGRWWWI